jgi:hypothetical protein
MRPPEVDISVKSKTEVPVIYISEVLKSSTATTFAQGDLVFERIKKLLWGTYYKGFKIKLSFKGIKEVTTAFLYGSIGQLCWKNPNQVVTYSKQFHNAYPHIQCLMYTDLPQDSFIEKEIRIVIEDFILRSSNLVYNDSSITFDDMRISVVQFLKSTSATTFSQGRILSDEITRLFNMKYYVKLSFKGVKEITTAFIKGSIGEICLKHPELYPKLLNLNIPGKLSILDLPKKPFIKREIKIAIEEFSRPEYYLKEYEKYTNYEDK